MNKIIILHRDDLYGLTRNEPIANIVYESFPDPLLKFLDADFIAFEDDITGLLKILKNNYGTCITISHEHFLMAIDRITKISAMEADFPKDMLNYDGATMVFTKPNPESINPKPNYRIGFDPAVVGCDVNAFVVRDNGVVKYIGRSDDREAFDAEVLKMKNYYGDIIIDDSSHLIDQQVKLAMDYHPRKNQRFPESLWEMIIWLTPKFDGIFKIMFQHSETYFTSTLKINYPEIYAEVKEECGFWCPDTKLYKDILRYGCTHEECMINTVLKAIYRFKNLGRNKSNDMYDIIVNANPNKNQS